jgi:MFS family permease
LPTYGSVGVIATVALVVLRFIQGFALGGESTAAGLMAIESSPGDQRGFSAAVIQAAGPVGVVLASLAALLISRLPEADLLSWGWRVPFLISAILRPRPLHAVAHRGERGVSQGSRGRSGARGELRRIWRGPPPHIFTIYSGLALTFFSTVIPACTLMDGAALLLACMCNG